MKSYTVKAVKKLLQELQLNSELEKVKYNERNVPISNEFITYNCIETIHHYKDVQGKILYVVKHHIERNNRYETLDIDYFENGLSPDLMDENKGHLDYFN